MAITLRKLHPIYAACTQHNIFDVITNFLHLKSCLHNASDHTRTRRAQGDPSLFLQFSLISMKTAVFFCCLDFLGGNFDFVRLLALKHFLVTWRAAKCCAWQGSFTSASKQVQLYTFYHFMLFRFAENLSKENTFLLDRG